MFLERQPVLSLRRLARALLFLFGSGAKKCTLTCRDVKDGKGRIGGLGLHWPARGFAPYELLVGDFVVAKPPAFLQKKGGTASPPFQNGNRN